MALQRGVRQRSPVGTVEGPRQAQQQLATKGGDRCRPLVSTQATVGVNLALGSRSRAEQSIETGGPRGLLATTTLARGVNVAAGARSQASQRILAQTGR